MESLVKGVHHITLCPGGAQEDVDFFTKVLGQRMVKQTVLMDGSIPIYHLYYANADVEIGSVATTCETCENPFRRAMVAPNASSSYWDVITVAPSTAVSPAIAFTARASASCQM